MKRMTDQRDLHIDLDAGIFLAERFDDLWQNNGCGTVICSDSNVSAQNSPYIRGQLFSISASQNYLSEQRQHCFSVFG